MPVANALIVSHRPRFLWSRRAEVDIDLCRDAACAKPIASFHASGSSIDSPIDLPPGKCWWRLREPGKPPLAARPIDVDVRIRIEGRYARLEVPESERVRGERVSALIDREVAFLSDYFGVKPPDEKLNIVTFVTPGALGIEHDEKNHAYLGRTESDASRAIEVQITPLSGPPERRHGFGRFAVIVAHEVAHAFQYRSFFNYRDLPTWWTEGMADVLASKIVGADNPMFAWRFFVARKALRSSRLGSLRSLSYATEASFRDPASEGLHYVEAYTVLATAEAKDPERFKALVRQIARMPKLPGFELIVNERILSALGGGSRLEEDWRSTLLTRDLGPWRIGHGALRRLTDGSYELEAPRDSAAVAWSEHPDKLSPLSFSVAGDEFGIVLELVGGVRRLVMLPVSGVVSLRDMSSSGYKHLVNGARVALGAETHTVTLAREKDHFTATLDGAPVLQFDLSGALDGWGIFVNDGLAAVTLR